VLNFFLSRGGENNLAVRTDRLRGRIVEKYGTLRAFAKEVGCSEVTMSRKLSEQVPFTNKDIAAWCDKLDISKDDLTSYFFD
jgi:hypothetical protein